MTQSYAEINGAVPVDGVYRESACVLVENVRIALSGGGKMRGGAIAPEEQSAEPLHAIVLDRSHGVAGSYILVATAASGHGCSVRSIRDDSIRRVFLVLLLLPGKKRVTADNSAAGRYRGPSLGDFLGQECPSYKSTGNQNGRRAFSRLE